MELPDLTDPERLWWLLLLPVLYFLARPPFPRRVVSTPHMVQWTRAQERLGRRPVRSSAAEARKRTHDAFDSGEQKGY